MGQQETERVVKPILAELGVRRDMLVWRQNSGSALDPHNLERWIRMTDLPGLPDIMGMYLPVWEPAAWHPGVFAIVFGVECKNASSAKLRKAQASVRKRFGELNAIWIKATCIGDVIAGFHARGIYL